MIGVGCSSGTKGVQSGGRSVWLDGTVSNYFPLLTQHEVTYSDGEIEELDLLGAERGWYVDRTSPVSGHRLNCVMTEMTKI